MNSFTDTSGLFAVYKYLFMAALLLIGVISVFVIIGISKAQKENKEIHDLQKEQLAATKEGVAILKEIRDKGIEKAAESNPEKE